MLFLLFLHSVRALPLASCADQSSQLHVIQSECDVNNERNVCLSWADGSVKSGQDTISHVCASVGGVKTENWNTTTPICVKAPGGSYVTFGVKDGSSCSLPGVYNVEGAGEAVCEGPLNVCAGGNTRECKWTVTVNSCCCECS